MLSDTLTAKKKGHVKVELYNDDGVFLTREKKNLVVLDANKIVGEALAHPAKSKKATVKDSGSTDGSGVFNLSYQPQSEKELEIDVAENNDSHVLTIPGGENITKLISVAVNDEELTVNQDVFIENSNLGQLRFEEPPKNTVKVTFRQVAMDYVSLVAGAEKVTVAGVEYKPGNAPSDADKVYVIDYDTGVITFETPKQNIEVTYDLNVISALTFMGIGDKPEGHPDNRPVNFSDSDKILKRMDGEYEGSRQLIQYPAVVTQGSSEIDVLPTKPVPSEEKMFSVHTTDSDDDGTADTVYKLETGGRKVLEIVSVYNKTTETGLVVGEDVSLVDEQGTLEFLSPPAVDVEFEVVVKVQAGNDHLIFELSHTPVLELVSVRHEDIDGNITSYKIDEQSKGLEVGKGDVWIINSSKGIVQFSESPSNGVLPQTPGQMTFEYKVNSGTTVQFVADFPKGVPGPMLDQKVESLNIEDGVVNYVLEEAVAKDNNGEFMIEVERNNELLEYGTDYTVSENGRQVQFRISVQEVDNVVVRYQWEKTTHVIYQVAMFTEQQGGDMFNISGIGPVTKDKNTGMRVTWSVTT